MDIPFWIYPVMMAVAFLYASVGHGGASGYMAVLSLAGVGIHVIKPSALLLNILVSATAFGFYSLHKHFRFSLFWPFALSSVPAAYWGASMALQDDWYKKILACCLLLSIIRIAGWGTQDNSKINPVITYRALMIGFLIGLVSGMIGIGGGIILSPVILLLRWGNMKETAAVSALFILLNSLSGFSALLANDITIAPETFYLMAVALPGGFVGSYMGSKYLKFNALRYLLVAVLLLASLKLLLI